MSSESDIDRRQVFDALERAGGNRKEAARILGIGRATLYRWLERLDLSAEVLKRIDGRYEVERTLGTGEQATVFLVRDRARSGAARALKLLKGSDIDGAGRNRLRDEFAALARLRHPGIVRVHEFGVDPESDRPYLVMDPVEGRPFAEALADQPVRTVARAMVETLAAVDALHRSGLIHRDLKSENVLVRAGGAGDTPQVTVMDLGLHDDLSRSEQVPGGTLLYAAPEMFRGARASARTDLYALGVLLYLTLTGRFPFQGATAEETIRAHRSGDPDPPSAWRSQIPVRLDEIVLRLLAADPEERYADAPSAMEDLAPLAGGALEVTASGTRLFGREEDLTRLEEAISGREGLDAGTPRPAILVRGESGIGKTALLDRALDAIRARGARVAATELRTVSPSWLDPVAQLLREALGGADGSGTSHADRVLARYRPALEREAPALLASLLGRGEAGERGEGGEAAPSGNPSLAIDTLLALLADLSDAKPLVLAIDGLERGDVVLHELVWRLARQGRRLPLRVVVTAREADLAGALSTWWQGARAEGLIEEIAVGPLDRDATRAMAEANIGAGRASMLGDRLYALTGGHPLFLEEVLRHLAGSDEPEAVELPGSIHQALIERTRAVGAIDRVVLDALATAREPVTEAELTAVVTRAGHDASDVLAAIARLETARLARRQAERVDVAHAPLRDALLAHLGDDARAWHRRWAEVLAERPDRLVLAGAHLIEANAGAEALDTLVAAADRLVRQWQHREAVRYYEAALERLADDPRRQLELFPALQRACHAMHDPRRPEAVCRRWAALAAEVGDLPAEARAQSLLAAALREQTRWEEAREAGARAVELARATGQDAAIALAEKILASVLWMSWSHREAMGHFERALEHVRRAPHDHRALALGIHDEAFALIRTGWVRRGLDGYAEAERLFAEAGDEVWAALMGTNLGSAWELIGDLDRGIEILRRVTDTLREKGTVGALLHPLENLVLMLNRAGRYREASRAASELVEEAIRSGRTSCRLSGLLALGDALFWLDERDAARDHHRLAKDLAEALGDEPQLQYARLARARDLRWDRRLDAAEAEAAAALEASRGRGNLRMIALAGTELGRIALARGDLDAAERYLEEADRALRVEREDGPAHRAAWLLEYARLARRRGDSRWARNLVEEGLGLARRAHTVEVEIDFLALRAALAEEAGDERVAAWSLACAARRVAEVAQSQDDPVAAARYRARPDRAGLIDAAARKGGLPGEGEAPTTEALGQLYEVSRAIVEGGDLTPLMERIVELAIERSGAERGLLLLRDENTGELRPATSRGVEQETTQDAIRISNSVLEAADRGRPVFVTDASSHPELSQAASVAIFGIRSVMCVPIRVGDEVLGTIYTDTREANAWFSEADLRFLQALADQAGIALAYGRLVGQLTQEKRALEREVADRRGFDEIIGRSPAMREVFDLVERVADANLPVLVLGESGTGKELIARALHRRSRRRDKPFLTKNCAAIPETLLEAELFGHVKGAFTGADQDRRGLFQAADGGTLFLDEVGEMSPGLQAKLLRVLQDGEVTPVGGERSLSVDVRVIAATHRDLAELAERGEFRQDLYFRLNGISIRLPPLRARREDIPLLVQHFLEREARAAGREPPRVEPVVMRALVTREWRGNVRELENTVRRLLLLCSSERIDAAVLASDPEFAAAEPAAEGRAAQRAAPPDGDDEERLRIERALAATGGKKIEAAVVLGWSRATLYRKLKRHGMV